MRTISRHDFHLSKPSSRFKARQGGRFAAGLWAGDPMLIEDRRLRLEALRNQSAPRLPGNAKLIVKPEGERPFRTTVGEFCRDNGSDPDLCDMVRALRPGQQIAEGGGASPWFIVRRPKGRR